jgi:hypothetical protein
MKPPLPRTLSAVPQTLHARLEIAKAIRTLAGPDEDELLRQRRAEIAAIRRDLEALSRDLHNAFEAAATLAKAELRAALKKYSADQPRVPAGNPDGGQWTTGDGGSESADSTNESDQNGSLRPVQYAALETATQTDANTISPKTRYVAGNEEDEFREGRGGILLEGTEEQQARLQGSDVAWRTVLSQVRKFDPSWKPSPVLVDPTSIEGNIAELKAWTEEAKGHLSRLRDLGLPRDRNTSDPISSPAAKTGNPFIDYTTEKLMDILDDVVGKIGARPDLDPAGYGMLVHTEFAKEVRAANLRGVAADDVERTFGVENNASYGAKDSIRPDVVLRDDGGDVIAMYDVKTGAGLIKFQVIRYRLRTGSDSYVPVFELRPSHRSIWKGGFH